MSRALYKYVIMISDCSAHLSAFKEQTQIQTWNVIVPEGPTFLIAFSYSKIF